MSTSSKSPVILFSCISLYYFSLLFLSPSLTLFLSPSYCYYTTHVLHQLHRFFFFPSHYFSLSFCLSLSPAPSYSYYTRYPDVCSWGLENYSIKNRATREIILKTATACLCLEGYINNGWHRYFETL